MKKGNKEAVELSKYISEFLDGYAELYLTGSVHTLKSYRLALALYLEYLEDEKNVHFKDFSKKCFENLFSRTGSSGLRRFETHQTALSTYG